MPSRVLLLITLLVLSSLDLAASSCCAQQTWTSKPVAEPKLYRVQMDPIVFTSDVPLPDVRQLHGELFNLTHRLHKELGVPLNVQQVQVFIFRDRAWYEHALSQKVRHLSRQHLRRSGMFVLQDGVPSIYALWNEELLTTLRHEWVHAQLNTACGEVPIWLDEGLAMYYQNDHWGPLEQTLSAKLAREMRSGWRPDLPRLEKLSTMQQMNARDYAEAWSWVRILQSTSQGRQAIAAYLAELRQTGDPVPLSQRAAGLLSHPTAHRNSAHDPAQGPVVRWLREMFR